MDSLSRFDPPEPKPAKVLRTLWGVMLGNGTRLATQRLYSAPRAKRFVRLAKRWGHDVYTTRFGRVRA